MISVGEICSKLRTIAQEMERTGHTVEADSLYTIAFQIESELRHPDRQEPDAAAPGPGPRKTSAVEEQISGETLSRAERMRKLAPFGGLSDRTVFNLAAMAGTVSFSAGAEIYTDGSPADSFFLVIEGIVSLDRETPAGPQPLGGAGPGEFLGLAETLLSSPHMARATARNTALLLKFRAGPGEPRPDAQFSLILQADLARYLRQLNDLFRTFFPAGQPAGEIAEPARPGESPMPHREKIRTLTEGGLSRSDLALFSSFCSERFYPAGSVIFREGDPGSSLFVISRGKVRISKRIPGAGEEALAILEPGSIFGEMAIFDPRDPGRSADAIAHEECALLALDRSLFETLLTREPESCADLSALLCRVAARRILETTERLIHWRHLTGQF